MFLQSTIHQPSSTTGENQPRTTKLAGDECSAAGLTRGEGIISISNPGATSISEATVHAHRNTEMPCQV